ncbi:GNAT family N-acetyltransferase [Bizionia psychrotolerans]|uniref:GNAT family N-acetyltransferase n=1 Tax=Bizionia psychrotolerans TaxID=1492901 RepID=UPI00065146C7|nr:GNAT family protein [Bizionia psychrotolerans]
MAAFDFSKEYILEDDVVLLRPLKISDVNLLLSISEEPHIWDYSFVKGNGIKNLTKYIEATIEARKNKNEYSFLVIDKRTNEVAGSTRFCDINLLFNAVRLGFTWYGEKFQGTGLNKHCKYLMFQFAFENIAFERIGFAAYAENTRSISAMKSVGCIEEGKFRSLFPENNGKERSDAVLFSLLRDEWLAEKKEALKSKLTN